MISKKKMAIYSIALIIITALVTSVAVEYKYGEYKKLDYSYIDGEIRFL